MDAGGTVERGGFDEPTIVRPLELFDVETRRRLWPSVPSWIAPDRLVEAAGSLSRAANRFGAVRLGSRPPWHYSTRAGPKRRPVGSPLPGKFFGPRIEWCQCFMSLQRSSDGALGSRMGRDGATASISRLTTSGLPPEAAQKQTLP